MVKNPKGLFFELLEYLSAYSIGVDVNIKPVCKKYFADSVKTESENLNDALTSFSKNLSKVFATIGSLEKMGYIKYSDEHDDKQEMYIVGGNYSVSLTKEGLDYYYGHVLRSATLKSLKTQFRYNMVTWAIAIAAILGTIGMGIYSTNQNKDLSQRLNYLQQELRQLKSQQHLPVATHKIPDTILKKP